MNYELAQQLKDVGWKFDLYDENSGIEPIAFDGLLYNPPTLSELIEACGDCNFQLQQASLFYPDEKWCAAGWRRDEDISTSKVGYGATPEEAVAMLWLALNKKQ